MGINDVKLNAIKKMTYRYLKVKRPFWSYFNFPTFLKYACTKKITDDKKTGMYNTRISYVF